MKKIEKNNLLYNQDKSITEKYIDENFWNTVNNILENINLSK